MNVIYGITSLKDAKARNLVRKFHAETFEEMAKLSQQHGKEMGEQSDQPHWVVIAYMSKMMQDPAAMQACSIGLELLYSRKIWYG